jgi:hypothetical protein
MRTLGRLAAELVGVLLAGAISFVVMIGCVLGIIFLWACGIASGLFLIVALFSGNDVPVHA